MAFGNLIQIGRLGITGAIKQRLLEENISVKNFDISIWQEIMDTIKDDENLRKVYTGSTNLKDKNAFFVAKGSTVNISDDLWNKVLNIINKFNSTLSDKSEALQTQTAMSQTLQDKNVSTSRGINLQAEYHLLPYNLNGDIDFNELTPEKLKSKFPEYKGIIEYKIYNIEDSKLY